MEFIALNTDFEYRVDARHLIKSVLKNELGQPILRSDLIPRISDQVINNELTVITDILEVLRLPEVGEQVVQDNYYVSEWGTLRCRQTHNMTIYNPIDIPALFSFFREDTGELEWIQNEQVNIGDFRFYESVKYEVIQSHQTQSDWTPNSTPTLWKVYSEVTEPEVSEWVQPTGAHDAYRLNDLVLFNNKTWKCISDYCVYAPNVFGWEVSE